MYVLPVNQNVSSDIPDFPVNRNFSSDIPDFPGIPKWDFVELSRILCSNKNQYVDSIR